jgi:tRNA-dihydrouridine synthase
MYLIPSILTAFVFHYSGGSSKIQHFRDINSFRASTGCSSVMLARVAQWNPSIFSEGGLQPIDEVIKKYIRYVSISVILCDWFQ